nr:hypothetical transcript [Hymenolepis microstoma]
MGLKDGLDGLLTSKHDSTTTSGHGITDGTRGVYGGRLTRDDRRYGGLGRGRRCYGPRNMGGLCQRKNTGYDLEAKDRCRLKLLRHPLNPRGLLLGYRQRPRLRYLPRQDRLWGRPQLLL